MTICHKHENNNTKDQFYQGIKVLMEYFFLILKHCLTKQLFR